MQKRKVFIFGDAEFLSAKEKIIILNQWRTFIKALVNADLTKTTGADYGYFPTELNRPFTDRLYQYLSGQYGFIAHYNRLGFLSSRFSTPEDIKETMTMLRTLALPGYEDLKTALLETLSANERLYLMGR